MADELESNAPKDRDFPVVITNAYVNSEWAGLADGDVVTVGETAATIGEDAFSTLFKAESITSVTDIEVVGGEISFSNGYYKSITVDAGATVVGTANFTTPITINGTIAFDTVHATSTEAQFGGFSFVSGTATYTLTDTRKTVGTYLLASDAAGFTGSVAFSGHTLSVGASAVLVGDFEYALGINNNNELVLRIEEYVPPTLTYDLVYVNSAWAGLPNGYNVIVGETTATIGYDAFVSGDMGIANVTTDGLVEVVAGEVTFTNTTSKAITIDANAKLVGKATFGAAITVNGTIAFDTVHATSTEAQFGGFSFVSGSATYTLTDAAPAAGTYLLASDAAGFTGSVAFSGHTLSVGGEAVTVGDCTYALSLTKGNLVLTVDEVFIPPVPVSDADDGWNNWLYDPSYHIINRSVSDSAAFLLWKPEPIQIDMKGTVSSSGFTNFVGQGDDTDFAKVSLETDAKLSFSVEATDAAVFTVWKLVESTGNGSSTMTQKQIQKTALSYNAGKGIYTAATATLSLEKGEYFLSMQSTNAAQGSRAYYNVELKSFEETSGESASTIVSGAVLKGVSRIVGDGELYIDTTVDYVGSFTVASGGKASRTELNRWGNMFVSNGGTAANTSINSGGWLTVSSGGTADNTSVDSGGKLQISSGGTATRIIENGGYVEVADGAVATFIPNVFFCVDLSGESYNCSATVHSGTTANSTFVNDGACMFVSSGGTANNTSAYSNGSLIVSRGGTANSTTIEGNMHVSSGGTANSTTVAWGGVTTVSGGIVNSTDIGCDGSLIVCGGGVANSTSLEDGASFKVYDGGMVNSTILKGGTLHISGNGTASITTVSRGDVTVSSGGTANNTAVDIYGHFCVSNGGTANNTILSPYDDDYWYECYCEMQVMSDATANSITISKGGSLYVLDGGAVNRVTVNDGGYMVVSGRGKAAEIRENGGYVEVSDDAVVTFVPNTLSGMEINGKLTVHSGTTACGASVNEHGGLFVFDGGIAKSTTINEDGSMTVYNGGMATGVTVSDCGNLCASSGGTAADIAWTPCSGHVFVADGAVATFVSQYSGVYYRVDYDLISQAIMMDGINVNGIHEMCVMSGGTANSTKVSKDGYLFIWNGMANDTIVSGSMYLETYGTSNQYVRQQISRGAMNILSGTANSTILNGGSMTVWRGGTANDTIVSATADYIYCCVGGGYDWRPVYSNFQDVLTVSGGTANRTGITGGSMTVCNGGTANATTVCGTKKYFDMGDMMETKEIQGVMDLLDGEADSTTVKSGGAFHISGGGMATGTTVSSGGNMTVSNGGTANSTTVNLSGKFTVFAGGSVTSTTINYGGSMLVGRRSLAKNTLVNPGCRLFVERGGEATISYTPFGMGVILSEEEASVVYLERDADINVYYGNEASGLVSSANALSGLSIDPAFSAIVYQRGRLDNATVSGGSIFISSGGTVTQTILNGDDKDKGGWIGVSSGGTANSIVVNSGGSLCVSGGGITNRASVNASGFMFVSSGGTATNIVWTPCQGHIVVDDGAVITFAEQYSGVYFGASDQLLSHAKTMDSEKLGYSYEMYVMSGGTANTATVAGGSLYVFSGGSANTATVTGGSLCVFSGGIVKGAAISGGEVVVSDDGAASNTMMSGGRLLISRGGTASRTTISGGEGFVSGGGTMNSVTMRQGQLTVLKGGEVNSVYVYGGNLTDGHGSYTEQYSAAKLYISGGAVVSSATVNGGFVYLNGTVNGVALRGSTYMSGKLFVNYGGIANGVVMSGGSLFVNDGGTVSSVAVESGLVTVSFGGIVNSMSVSSGGSMAVSGGKLTGRMSFADGATVIATKSWEATIDFNLMQTTPKNEVLLNNLSAVQGDFLYTLTVSDMQRKGLYRLAAKANDFYSTISIVNDLGTKLGSVGVGETAMIGDADYTLNLENGVLTLLVERDGADDLTAPTVSNIKASTTAPAQSVTVTAVFKDNIELKSSLYKLGENSAWKAYEDGVTVTENTTIYFKAVDAAGNESAIKSYKVTNIKNADPIVPDEPGGGGTNENADDGTANGSIFDDQGNVKESFAESTGTVIKGDTGSIVLDEGVSQPDDTVGFYNNFVGYGDAVDYAKFTLEKASNLSFEISATDAVKFTIYTLDEKTKKLKAVQTTTLKKGEESKPTAAKLLEAGEYYISMQSTNAKKADAAAFYNVELGTADLYLDGDDSTNNWLYEGGKKGRGLNTDVAGEAVAAKVISRDTKGKKIQVDAKKVEHDDTGKYSNFVGFGDVTDYVKVHLDKAANLSLTVECDKAAKLTICQLTYKNEVVTGSKTLVTTTLKAGNGSVASKLKLLDAGDYYIAVTSTNAKKGDEAYYNVYVNSRSVFFDNCDDQTNDWLYEGGKKGRGENTTLVNSEGITIVDTLKNVQVDASIPAGEPGDWKNFIGYGDTDDYRKIVIVKDGATACFKVDAKDQAKFVIYSYDKATHKMKALQTSKLKKDGDIYTVTTASYTFKTAGEYYIAVTSTNAKKGGNAYYNVELVSTNITAADLLGNAQYADLALPEPSSGLLLTDDLSFAQNDAAALADVSATSLAELNDKSGWLNVASLA